KGRMIRMNQYKYNLYSKGERSVQLFDLDEDPGEVQNLASEPYMQTVKESLHYQLVNWMEETGDDFLNVWEKN
ncbi:MAG: DUF4976 domain-containing protein, partial [Bacteroidales bacterium]|nr:DUF4976 domain-containing protein [Bacteroidales bacterium]